MSMLKALKEYAMENDQDKNKRQVTSVGNAWIICHSKSYPGRIYYFNTFNGKTAWNLSDAEIEKAKRATEILQSQPGANLRKCPEPKDQPPMNLDPKYTPSRIYNKQIINNQFPNNATCSSSFNSVNPLNTLSIPAFNSYNPYVWAHAPNASHTPIFLLPIVNHAGIIKTEPDNNSQQGFSEQSSSVAFTNLPKSRNNTKRKSTFKRHLNRGGKTFNTWHNNRVGRGRGNIVKNHFRSNKNDLRQILLTKRNFSKALFDESSFGDTSELTDDKLKKESNDPEEIFWNKDIQEFKQESPSRFNVKPLRDLADSNKKLDCWYIVADTEVMLNNFNFLITLTDSDAQCHLMVPRHVMSELHAYASVSENALTRRTVRFLCQHIETGCVFIDEESMDRGENESSSAFNTCLKLAKDNYHVILISNDIHIKGFKHNISVFSIQEIKSLVTSEPHKQLSPTAFGDIKIVISNDINKKTTKSEGNIHTNVVSILSKPSLSTDVQIDTTKPNTYTNSTQNSLLDEIICTKMTGFEDTECEKSKKSIDNPPSDDKTCKRRKLRLQRNVSNKKVANQSPEKKAFKWRRNRNVSSYSSDEPKLLSIDSNIKTANDINIQMKQSKLITEKHDNNDENNLRTQLLNESADIYHNDYVESSESNIDNHKNVSENIIIEETSASEVISNTVSNVDSENFINPKQLGYKLHPKKAMYTVADEIIEEYLKTRCDEWVSRFVQIMEEVLREILQQDPPFQNTDLPPPWTLHEATRCIIKKFCNHYHIVDAANNLSLVLFMNSDNKGNIDKNMEPSKYMEMFSFGVYLIDTLKNVIINSEDLHTAGDSLKNLLYDIENPNMDTSNNDTFVDDLPNPSANLGNNTNNKQSCDFVNKNGFHNHLNDHLERNNETVTRKLRSTTRKMLQKQNESQQKPELNNENIFFNSLELWKKDEYNKNGIGGQSGIQDSPNKDDNIIKLSSNANSDKEESHCGTINEPNFIRNFSKFAEFEEKLMSPSKKYYGLDEEFSSNYADDFDYSTEEYFSDDYSGNKDNTAEGEKVFEGTDNQIETNKRDHENLSAVNPVVDNKKIKRFIGMFLLEINETFSKIHAMCEKNFKELSEPQQSSQATKQVIQEKVKKTYLQIDNIYKLLGSILDREMADPDNNIQNLLKNVNIVFDEELSIEYRKSIVKCKDHAFSLLNIIKYINTMS